MKWRFETQVERESRLGNWHRWFAWYPAKINGSAVWLSFIWRRRKSDYYSSGCFWIDEYSLEPPAGVMDENS